MEAYSDGLNRRLGWLYACFGELYFCNNLGLIGNMGAFQEKLNFNTFNGITLKAQ
tara:strand:+ start:612 stop:776 length:165 start_codon:yes stop_codon:yes gene_type:complete